MKFIKIAPILICLIGILPSLVFSQTYTNVPGDTVEVTAFMEDLEVLTIQQLNVSANPITLKWQKVSAVVPASWDAAVCDNVLCHPALADSGTMNPVNPGANGYLLMHITGHVNFGTAVIRYAVWDANFPSIKDTLTYIMHVYDPTGIETIQNDLTVSVYPNPVSDVLDVSTGNVDPFKVKIINTSGSCVFESTSSYPHKINTRHLAIGTYYILIGSEKKYTIKKIVKE